EPPTPSHPRCGLAANPDTRGPTPPLEADKDKQIGRSGGTLDLPFGQLDVAFDETQLTWQNRRMQAFAPIAEYRVFGLQAHYRESGIGAPLAASLGGELSEGRQRDLLRAELTLPVTALLRSPRSRTALAWPPFEATLELYAPDTTNAVEIAGRPVPLASEPTAVLAFSL